MQVDFQNVQMRYRDGLPLVLRGLSVKVAPGARCGVVGRTGAGKSSLINCLFRRVAHPSAPQHLRLAVQRCNSEMPCTACSHRSIVSCPFQTMVMLPACIVSGMRLHREF